MSDHHRGRSRAAATSSSPVVRTPGRIRLAVVGAVLSLVAAACGSKVAGVASDSSIANPTASSGTGPTGSSSTGSGPSVTDGAPSTGSAPSTDSVPSTDSTEESSEPSTSSSSESSSTSESPSTSETDPSSSSGADDAKLYPTKPIPYNVTPNTEGIASLVEGRRLAGFVLDPVQIEGNLTDFVAVPTFPLRDAGALAAIFPAESTQTIARRQGMYTGYAATRSDPASKSSMVLAVFVFPSAAAAQKAAPAMATSSTQKTDSVVKYADLPGALGNQGAVGTTEFSGQAFIAAGQTVVYVYVSGGVSQKAAVAGRMKAALIKQVAVLDKYKPIAKSALMSQKFDPTGLYARTLPPKENYTVYGVYSKQGALHTQSDAPAAAKAFAAAGVDIVSLARSVLYRTKDAAAATGLRDAFYAQEVAANTRYRDFDPGTTAGGARCLQDSVQSQYICYATVDRVTIEYSSQSETDLKRSLEAQVALLQP